MDQDSVRLPRPPSRLHLPACCCKRAAALYCTVLHRLPQCYDKYLLSHLKACAHHFGQPSWGLGGPHDAGSYCQWPHQTGFFHQHGSWSMPYGKFFLQVRRGARGGAGHDVRAGGSHTCCLYVPACLPAPQPNAPAAPCYILHMPPCAHVRTALRPPPPPVLHVPPPAARRCTAVVQRDAGPPRRPGPGRGS